jgi:hypothetical protein
MLFSVSGPRCSFADEVSPKRIDTWSRLLVCTEREYAEMAEHVSDDVALMRTQCQIRRLEIAMNWAPRGSSRPDTSSFWDSCRRYEFFKTHWEDVYGALPL